MYGSVEFLKICPFFIKIEHRIALDSKLYCSSLYFVDINLPDPWMFFNHTFVFFNLTFNPNSNIQPPPHIHIFQNVKETLLTSTKRY